MRSTSALFVRLAGHDGFGLDGLVALVEPQVGLARGAVGPVAGEAVLGQDGPHVAVVFDLLLRGVDGETNRGGTEDAEKRQNSESGAGIVS